LPVFPGYRSGSVFLGMLKIRWMPMFSTSRRCSFKAIRRWRMESLKSSLDLASRTEAQRARISSSVGKQAPPRSGRNSKQLLKMPENLFWVAGVATLYIVVLKLAAKNLTTKDTKLHEGLLPNKPPFVFLRVLCGSVVLQLWICGLWALGRALGPLAPLLSFTSNCIGSILGG
jgi:hypothetical protein